MTMRFVAVISPIRRYFALQNPTTSTGTCYSSSVGTSLWVTAVSVNNYQGSLSRIVPRQPLPRVVGHLRRASSVSSVSSIALQLRSTHRQQLRYYRNSTSKVTTTTTTCSNRLNLFMETNRHSTATSTTSTSGGRGGRGQQRQQQYAGRGYHSTASGGSNNATGQGSRGRTNPYNAVNEQQQQQQQQIRSATTITKKKAATTETKPKASNAKTKTKSKSPDSKKKSTNKTLLNGEKGAAGHTVEEEYRIRLTRSIMELREKDDVETLKFPATLTNTERKFVHELARRFGLSSKSNGKGDDRSITVRKPALKTKTTALNEDYLPTISMGPWGKDALHRFVMRYPPSPEETLESHETGTSLLQALGRGDTDDAILTRLTDLGLTDTFMMDENSKTQQRKRHDRPVDLQRRHEYHNKAQRRKQSHATFSKMMNQRIKLPAYRHFETVVETVAQHPITIISGETGCGKSTQIPQFILDANPTCKMIVTQPRRISAISIAERVAEEQCQGSVGGIVGYQVRLESSFTNDTQCIFMTPGILLNKMNSILDPNHDEYTHLIIDEIHERGREQEFLLIILRDLLPKRPDLRVILMSATLQTSELVDYFEKGGITPAVIEMEGRTFPVQEYFLEQVLEMTGFIDPSSKYDVGSKLEAEMAKVTGAKMDNDKVANVSLECAMCGKQGFTDPLALGEHIALCDGGFSFFKQNDTVDNTKKPDDSFDAAYEKYVSNYGDFDLFDVQSKTNQSDKNGDASSAGDGNALSTKEAIAKARKGLSPTKNDKSSKSGEIGIAAKSTVHFNELMTTAPVASNVEISPKEKALLTKYHATQDDEDIDVTLILELVRYITRLSYGDGGILVFLPGWFEISYLTQLLESTAPFSDRSRFLVLPLHSGIASRDQRRVMQPPPKGVRKIVLSTNIAETSLTINDIVYVIDTGRAKEKNYDPHLKSSTLQPAWISRASAKQRKGRAGRVKPGICFHLYSRTRHESMQSFTESELLRTPLEEMCLTSKRLGLAPGGPEDEDGVPAFLAKAMNAPHSKSVSNALELLVNLGAIYPETNQLTALGHCLSLLSLEPRVGKMVIWSYVLGCSRVASNMAVAMSFKSPFLLPLESDRRAAQQSLIKLSDNSESDQITIHKVLETVDEFRSGYGQLHDFCNRNYIGTSTIQMMADSRVNLTKELTNLGFPHPSLRNQYHNRHDSEDALWHAAIAAGLYPNIGTRKNGDLNFSTMNNQKLKIHPSSVNAAKGQRLVAKCQISPGEIEFVCYGEVLKGEQLSTASQTTRLQSPLPILLLCGTSLRVQPHPTNPGEAILNLDDWLIFKCDATLASHIVVLRKRLHSAFWSTIKEPSHEPKLSEEESNAVEILGTILRSAQVISSCPI